MFPANDPAEGPTGDRHDPPAFLAPRRDRCAAVRRDPSRARTDARRAGRRGGRRRPARRHPARRRRGARARPVPPGARARVRRARRRRADPLPRRARTRVDRGRRGRAAAAAASGGRRRPRRRRERRGLRRHRAARDRRRDRPRRGRQLRDPPRVHRVDGCRAGDGRARMAARAARARTRGVLDVRAQHPGARRGRRDARAARLVDRRRRVDEPDQRHLPARRRRPRRRRVPRLPRRRQGARGARDGRRRGAEDDERRLPRRRPHPGPVPQADVAAHAHRVPPRGAVGARPPRGAAPHDVRADRDRLARWATRARSSRVTSRRPRVLRGRARAVHAATRTEWSTSTRRSSSAPPYLDGAGAVRVPVGATLVRHSDPAGEVAETRAKAAGVLTALGALPRGAAPGGASTSTGSRRCSTRATTTSPRSGERRRRHVRRGTRARS